jgi:hypothetical protein
MTDQGSDGQMPLRFWQRGGGYDHNLWSPDRIWEKIDYIHANPVRRALVSYAKDWNWSSYLDYVGVRQGDWLLKIDRENLPVRVG